MSPVRPTDDVLALAPCFVPVLGFRPRGQHGEHLAGGVGASLEFEDRRTYAPGDDVRHVDWQVLARTGELLVRVHREEVQPRIDVLLDTSLSMAVEPEKAQSAVDLAALFLASGESSGFAARLFCLGRSPRPISTLEFLGEGVEFDGQLPLGEALAVARPRLSSGGLVLCISDFLAEHGPGLGGLATDRGAVALLQVLGPWESDPKVGEQLRLVDAESAGARDMTLDAGLVRRYRERLERLGDELSLEARRLGMRYSRVTAGGELENTARNLLIPTALLAPA